MVQDYTEAMRAHEEVLDWVEQELRAGRLRLGERLPPERALAEQLGVSRSGVREALRVLESLGILRSGVGSGPTAGTVVVAEPGPALGAALRLHLATGHIDAQDVVGVRLLLEQTAARSQSHDSGMLAQLEPLLEAMTAPENDVDEFLALDAEFHIRLAAASGNPLLGIVMAALREAIRGYTRERVAALHDWPATVDRLQQEHIAILYAVQAGSHEQAAQLLEEHIEGYLLSDR